MAFIFAPSRPRKGEALPGLFCLLAFAMVAPYVAAALKFARAISSGQPLSRSTAFAFGILTACVIVLFCLGLLPLIGLFAGLWMAALVAFAALRRDSSRRTLLTANAVSLAAMLSCSLVYFGYMSATGLDSSMGAGAGELERRCALLACGLALACLLLLALGRILDGAYPASERADRALQPFLVFSLYGIGYELLDLVPSMLNVWFPLMPLFLLGGTALLTVFCAVFALVSARLGVEVFHESENIALERKRLDQEMHLRLARARATTDQLTGLATRRVGQQRLDEKWDAGIPFAIAYLDVDGLKEVNDEHGHLAGDAYLAAFAHRLAEAFPDADVIRWGGDEFLVIGESELPLRERLMALEGALAAERHDPPLQFSFGVSLSTAGVGPESLLHRADQAMYAEKRRKHERAAASEGGSR